jgi:hypothetical protein
VVRPPGLCHASAPGAVDTGGVRTAKAMGLRNLPSKSWQVDCGWVIASNIATDLTARTHLLHPSRAEIVGEALLHPSAGQPVG